MREVIADLEEAIAWLKNDVDNEPPKTMQWHLNFFVGGVNHLLTLAYPIDKPKNKS